MIAFYILLPLAAVALLILWLVFRKTFFVSAAERARREAALYEMPHGFGEMDREMRRLVSELEALPFESVAITARDGTPLFARYYHVRDGAPLEIEAHGYRGHAIRDFCGGNPLARELSHNVLLIDQRAHGKSGSRTITFGIRERLDLLDWVAYATARFGEIPIFLVGISMGGASVLMASGEPLPPSVVGVIADCPYSAPRDIIRSVIRMMHLPPALAYPLVAASARLFGRFSLSECTAVDAVARSRVPLLLLHGECDRLVPCEMSRRIAAAAEGRARLATFPGADHGMSFTEDPDRYAREITEFCADCLSFVKNT